MDTLLKYSLDTPGEKSIIFQVQYQSEKVNKFFDFMERSGKDYFQTATGYKIKRGAFPEIKETKNIIYLRGYNKALDNKVDETKAWNKAYYRDAKAKAISEALAEFTNAVRKADSAGLLSPTYQVSFYSTNKNPLAGINDLGYCAQPCRYNDPFMRIMAAPKPVTIKFFTL